MFKKKYRRKKQKLVDHIHVQKILAFLRAGGDEGQKERVS